jgi:hypothetical protein
MITPPTLGAKGITPMQKPNRTLLGFRGILSFHGKACGYQN